jgi:hypothetical protein
MLPFTVPAKKPHNRVAKNALGGVGGLYRLRAGHESLDNAAYATWFQSQTAFRMQTSTRSLDHIA